MRSTRQRRDGRELVGPAASNGGVVEEVGLVPERVQTIAEHEHYGGHENQKQGGMEEINTVNKALPGGGLELQKLLGSRPGKITQR